MMDNKTFWFALLTVLAVLVTANSVSALATSVSTTVSGIDITTQPVTIFAGETIPLRVSFTADTNATDVRVKAWISGYRSDISDSSERFDIISGSRYTSELLTLTAPSDIDINENVLLVVSVETKDAFDETTYDLNLQRGSYEVEVMSVEVQVPWLGALIVRLNKVTCCPNPFCTTNSPVSGLITKFVQLIPGNMTQLLGRNFAGFKTPK